MDENMKIELTGNPFVDTGLGVICSLVKPEIDDIGALTLAHLKSVHGDGTPLADLNSKLKAFTQVFGTNNPLFQPSYGFKKGKGPSETNMNIYISVLNGLLSEIGESEKGPRCWACGRQTNFNFSEVCKKAITENGKIANDDKWVGRDWFPLAGSLGNDAQALPAASQSPYVCPSCLFAIHYLPRGLMLLEGKLTVFQSNSTDFWFELVRGIVEDGNGKINLEQYETLGKKGGSKEFFNRILKIFNKIQKNQAILHTEEITLYLWRFSNSGASPECQIEEIPNFAIRFLWEAKINGLEKDILKLIDSEEKNPRYSLFRCILERRDYLALYPEGRREGASPKLYNLYQNIVRNHSKKALIIASTVANEISSQLNTKELRRIQRPEAFKEKNLRNQVRICLVDLAGKGHLTLENYLDLFPIKEGQGVTVEWYGWDLIRFYLHHVNDDLSEDLEKLSETSISTNKNISKLFYCAVQIYNVYINEKGKDRFEKEVIAQMGRNIDILWLRNQFVQLAESRSGFTYGAWSDLCKLENGSLFVSELLFQMRILWRQWLNEDQRFNNVSELVEESMDGLPTNIKFIIESEFNYYINERGLDRFHRDVLQRLRGKEIGLFWFREKLTKGWNLATLLSEKEWEEFLIDDEGQNIKSERLFQLHLFVANLYRKRLKED